MTEFHKGDVVQVKSGGPLMTVHEVNAEGLKCIWMDYNQAVRKDTIPSVSCKVIDLSKNPTLCSVCNGTMYDLSPYLPKKKE